MQFYGYRKLWLYLHSGIVEEYFVNNYAIQFYFSFVLFDVFWSTKDHGEAFDALIFYELSSIKTLVGNDRNSI